MNQELPDVQTEFRKGKGTRSNWQHQVDHRKTKGITKKIYLCFIDYTKAFDSDDHNILEKS